MSYHNPHLRPGHPGYRPPAPAPSSGNAVLKTCLIIAGILAGIGLVVVAICGLSGWFMFNTVREAAEEQERRMEEHRAAIELANRPPDPPSSVKQALDYLNRADDKHHRVAAEWLAGQPVDRAFQARVNKALAGLLKSSPSDTQQAALDALNSWGDESVAGDVALSLRPNDRLNPQKLDLLAKWKQKIGAEKVAALLTSDRDASKAADTLKAIGPGAAPYVADQLSKGGLATEHAKKLLDGWGMDTSKALIQLYAGRLRSDNIVERRDAIRELKSLPFDESLQELVADAIVNTKLNGSQRRELMPLLEKWGNKECLPFVHSYIREQTYQFEDALPVVAKIGDPSSLPILAEVLPRTTQRNELIINTFVQFGQPALDEVLPYANHEQDAARKRAREIVFRLDASEQQVLDQCIDDLGSAVDAHVKAAVEWLDTIDVDEEKQSEVAAALGRSVGKLGVFEKRLLSRVLGRWATGEEVDYLIDLMDESDKEVWLPAFESALKLGKAEEMKFVTADLLETTWKREDARDAMVRCGQPCEELAIMMLNHNDTDVGIEMIKLLGAIGTQPSVEALGRVSRNAQRQRAKTIMDLADDAKRAILARLRDSEERSDAR